MSEALLFGLILFVLVAAIIGARAWLKARPVDEEQPRSAPQAAPPHSAPPDAPGDEDITVVDNVIVIADWQAEVNRRRNERSEGVG
ncbi:MAG: hypothetical protein AAFV53_21590 [Myxococcota bacterium]